MLLTWQVWESCDGSGRGFCWERSSPATTPSATASSGKNRDDSFRVEWTQWFYYGGFQLRRWWWWWWWWWWWFVVVVVVMVAGGLIDLKHQKDSESMELGNMEYCGRWLKSMNPWWNLNLCQKQKREGKRDSIGQSDQFFHWPCGLCFVLWTMGSHQSGTSWCTILTSGWVK